MTSKDRHENIIQGNETDQDITSIQEHSLMKCWSGSIIFPSATPNSSISINHCDAIHIKTFLTSQSPDNLWKQVSFPRILTIQGRIEVTRAIDYWKQISTKRANRCISIAKISTNDETNLELLYNHLLRKERYAVIYSSHGKPFPNSKNWVVKDLYLAHFKGNKIDNTISLPEPFNEITTFHPYGLFLIAVLSKSEPNSASKRHIPSIHHRSKKKDASIDTDLKSTIFKDEPLGEGILSSFLSKK